MDWNLLREAADKAATKDLKTYVELKEMLKRLKSSHDDRTRADFENQFKKYYALNSAGLSEEFTRVYFDLLFQFEWSNDPYTPPLERLGTIINRNKRPVLPVSFVSKLVAMHDDSSPIFDIHVSNYFGYFIPGPKALPMSKRIELFKVHVGRIRSTYEAWAKNSTEFEPLRKVLIAKEKGSKLVTPFEFATSWFGLLVKRSCWESDESLGALA